MNTIKLGRVGAFFEPRFNDFTWVKDVDTDLRKCAGMTGEFLHGKTPLQLVNIISLHGQPITRIEIANTPGKKGMFLFDKKGRIVAHVADAHVMRDLDDTSKIEMLNRVLTVMEFVCVANVVIDRVVDGIASGRYESAILSREPQEGFDDDVLTHDQSVRPDWALWFPN